MYASALLFVVFSLGFVVSLYIAYSENDKKSRWYIVWYQLILFVMSIITAIGAASPYDTGYPTNVRLRNGVYQKVATITLPKEKYLVAREPSGKMRLFSLIDEDDTSSTLWLKVVPFKRRPDALFEDLAFHPLLENKSQTEIFGVGKP
jgi:hypothetical protein